MSEILFTTRQQVIDFVKSRNQEDHEIKWKCPHCGTINVGAYYSHGSPCGGCDKFVFPRLNIKEILKDDEEADMIAKEIKKYGDRISRQREIIADLEGDLEDERSALRDIQDELKELKTCSMIKVRDW